MKKFVFLFFLFGCFIQFALEAKMYHQFVETTKTTYVWTKDNLEPFDELILSFNASRPRKGEIQITISLKGEEWSQSLLYATWGTQGQQSYHALDIKGNVEVFQDAIKVLKGNKASGFTITIVSTEKNLNNIFSLHAYTNSDFSKTVSKAKLNGSHVLSLKGISQMRLNHVRYNDLCSPVSLTAVIRYLMGDFSIDPCVVASNVLDRGFDIYGNWIFATAEAFTYLNKPWSVYVERLSGFQDIMDQLNNNIPVIISLRGPVKGGALPYLGGHLMIVIGYQEENQRVFCMDPAFNSPEETITSYDLEDFLQAWNKKGRLAYMFCAE